MLFRAADQGCIATIGHTADGHRPSAVVKVKGKGKFHQIQVDIQHGGAIALDDGGFAAREGTDGNVLAIAILHRGFLCIPLAHGHFLTGGATFLLRGVIVVLRTVIGVLEPVDHGVLGAARIPVGIQGGGTRRLIGEGYLAATGGSRIPASKGIAGTGGLRRRIHLAAFLDGLGLHRRTALGVEVDPVGRLEHRVEVHSAVCGHIGLGNTVNYILAILFQGPAHQLKVAGGHKGCHLSGNLCCLPRRRLNGFYHLAVLIEEVDIVDAIKLGIDVVGHIRRQFRHLIAAIQRGRTINVPALEDAVPGGGSGQLHRLASLQDLGGTIDDLSIRSSRSIIELIGRHIGDAHRVDGEVLRHEGDLVGADLPGEQTLDEVHDLLQETKVLVNIVQRLVRIHMEYAQLLVALEGRRLDAHLHRALRLPGRAINRDVDVVGPQGLHPLQLHRDRNRSDYRVFGDVAGDGNDRAVTGCAADGYRSQCLDRQEAEHHHQRQYQG